jgi:NAD(P)-dependent dehydrogenase (short-subunit alcohol dehydrogenase family)
MKLPDSARVVVTGAGSGLGRAFALQLASRRARILVTDVGLMEAENTAAEVARLGGTAEALAVDVTRYTDLEHAADTADRLWGGTDLLINNAGVGAGGLVGEIPLSDWEWILRINLWGAIHGCHAFVPRMKQQRAGFLLNVASNAGIASLPEMASYNVSKAAVISLSETLYAELAAYGIQVSVLCPTFFRTNLLASLRAPSERQHALARAAFERSKCSAEQVARAGLCGLEKGRLIVVPQLEGRLVWWAKRLFPGLYHWALRRQQREDLAAQWLLSSRSTDASVQAASTSSE